MSNIKKQVINDIIRLEGGYVNNPADKGGATNYGITEKVARDFGYKEAMEDLPLELAKEIYASQYWDINSLDDIAKLSDKVAFEVADTGVNMGTKVAAKFLQRSINVLNKRKSTELIVDGIIGKKTLAGLSNILREKSGEEVLLKALNILQGYRYIELTEGRELNKTFIYGWLSHRVRL